MKFFCSKLFLLQLIQYLKHCINAYVQCGCSLSAQLQHCQEKLLLQGDKQPLPLLNSANQRNTVACEGQRSPNAACNLRRHCHSFNPLLNSGKSWCNCIGVLPKITSIWHLIIIIIIIMWKATGRYRTYLSLVKLQLWFLRLQWKTCLWTELQYWFLLLQ